MPKHDGDQRPLDELEDPRARVASTLSQRIRMPRATEATSSRARVDVLEGAHDLREGVLAVGLEERQVALRIGVPADRMGDLLEDDEQADPGEHPLDDRRREEVGEHARAGDAEADLDQARPAPRRAGTPRSCRGSRSRWRRSPPVRRPVRIRRGAIRSASRPRRRPRCRRSVRRRAGRRWRARCRGTAGRRRKRRRCPPVCRYAGGAGSAFCLPDRGRTGPFDRPVSVNPGK